MSVEAAISLQRGKAVKALPYPVYLWTVRLLAAVGLVDSMYLAWSHFRNYTDIEYQSFCAITRALNCDTVSQSPYAIFLGVPVAVWGAVGYVLFLSLLACKTRRDNTAHERPWTLLFWVAAVFCLSSVVLGVISSVKIKSYCIMCLLSYVINFALLFYVWIIRRRFGIRGLASGLIRDVVALLSKKSMKLVFLLGYPLLLVALVSCYPKYWHYDSTARNPDIAQGVTADGSPWIGAVSPKVEIIEYADYMCFQCGKMNAHLHQLVAQHRDTLRLVHRHFPLDSRFNFTVHQQVHPNSGMVAMFAIFAATQGKFWEVNDALFRDAREKRTFELGEIAKEFGLDFALFRKMLSSGELLAKLKEDIRSGSKAGVNSTPSYVIDGKLYRGVIPPEILSEIEGK